MTQPELYIISDLHLCDGSRLEDFRSEDERALVSFLFRLGRAPVATLIINGDFIDFVQIQPRPGMWFNHRLDASEAESLEKLERAIAAHGPVFDALGRFVAAGHSLRFHVGNHDIDLVWPGVQARIRERLSKKNTTSAITFGERFVEAGLYVEHGHQADPPNSFPTQPHVLHPDPQGVVRLERCWGTRLVEEFYNKIEALDGCDMLDNVRPRMQAAVIIIKYAILHRQMHATLYAGVKAVVETLGQLETEQDVGYAATQLGVNRRVLGWLVSVAGWLGVSGHDGHVAKSGTTSPFAVPSLQTAYVFGAGLRDGRQLVELAPPFESRALESVGVAARERLEQKSARASSGATLASAAAAIAPEYWAENNQQCLRYAAAIAERHPSVRAVCFGHTHQAVTPALSIDGEAGWPMAGVAARYHNSGSWTNTLNLNEIARELATFEYLTQPKHYRKGRDYLRVTWPDRPSDPRVETLAWS